MGITSILFMEIQSHLPGKQRTLFQLYRATHTEHRHSLAKGGDGCAYCAFTISYTCAVVQRTLFRRKEPNRGLPLVFNHCVGHDPIDRAPTAGGKELQVGRRVAFTEVLAHVARRLHVTSVKRSLPMSSPSSLRI